MYTRPIRAIGLSVKCVGETLVQVLGMSFSLREIKTSNYSLFYQQTSTFCIFLPPSLKFFGILLTICIYITSTFARTLQSTKVFLVIWFVQSKTALFRKPKVKAKTNLRLQPFAQNCDKKLAKLNIFIWQQVTFLGQQKYQLLGNFHRTKNIATLGSLDL